MAAKRTASADPKPTRKSQSKTSAHASSRSTNPTFTSAPLKISTPAPAKDSTPKVATPAKAPAKPSVNKTVATTKPPAKSSTPATSKTSTKTPDTSVSATKPRPLTSIEDAPKSLWASDSEVAHFAAELPEEFLLCREMGHRWLPYQAAVNADQTYHRALRCPRCKTRKEQEISARGVILSTQYRHPEGYLHAGMGRIAGDGRGLLRLESIKRTIKRVESRRK